MRPPRFPYQQGELDSLCSLYAVLNLLTHRGKLEHEKAFDAMVKLVAYVKSHGDIESALLWGVYRGDVVEFFGELGFPNCQKYNNPDDDLIRDLAQKGAVIFVDFPNDDKFTHYTVIDTSAGLGAVKLLDSYGCSKIKHSGGKWSIDGKDVRILNIYALGDA